MSKLQFLPYNRVAAVAGRRRLEAFVNKGNKWLAFQTDNDTRRFVLIRPQIAQQGEEEKGTPSI